MLEIQHTGLPHAARVVGASSIATPVIYSHTQPLPPYPDDAHNEVLPTYQRYASVLPWLELLRHPAWESNSDLALFLRSDGHPDPPKVGWKAQYMSHVHDCLEMGLAVDPCNDVEQDHMFQSLTDEVRSYVRAEMPPELRSAALSLACRSLTPEPLKLSPFFLDALTAEASRPPSTIPSALPTRPSPDLHWILAELRSVNPELHLLDFTYLPQRNLDAIVKALFVLRCRERFSRAARRRVSSRQAGTFSKWLKGTASRWKKAEETRKRGVVTEARHAGHDVFCAFSVLD